MEAVVGVRLDAKTHRYYLADGREVPGFTAICKDLGIIKDNKFYSEFGRKRGIAVHSWVRFLAEGNEPSEEPDERISGYVAAFRKFLAESGFKFEGGEEPMYHPSLFFATTPDLYGDLNGVLSVIDVKGGAKELWHTAQTAAQKLALNANRIPVINRYALYLKPDSYRLVQHTDNADSVRWAALVAAYHAKRFFL